MQSAGKKWLIGLASSVAFIACGCGRDHLSADTASPQTAQGDTPGPAAAGDVSPVPTASVAQRPLPSADPVVILQTTMGDIQVRLFADKAPQTVDNFLRNYVQRGFYDQTIFHHVEPGVMLLAGGYTAELEAKPTRAPIFNESRNGLSNRRGTLAMVRDPEAPHSATSQFFINLRDNPDLDFRTEGEEELFGYCVFGEVIAGMEVVDQIASRPTDSRGEFPRIPSPPVAILSIRQIH